RPHPVTVTQMPATACPVTTIVGRPCARSPVALAAMSRPPIHATASYPASVTSRTHRLVTLRTSCHRAPPVSASPLTQPPVLTAARNAGPLAYPLIPGNTTLCKTEITQR